MSRYLAGFGHTVSSSFGAVPEKFLAACLGGNNASAWDTPTMLLPDPGGAPGPPPPGYQMMYLMPDGRMMPAHPMGAPHVMMGAPHPGAPPPMHTPGWGAPEPNWGGTPGAGWAPTPGSHLQHNFGHQLPPPPPPPGLHQHPQPPWRAARPPPPPVGSVARNPINGNSPFVPEYGVAHQGHVGSNPPTKHSNNASGSIKQSPLASAPAPGTAPSVAPTNPAGGTPGNPKKGKPKNKANAVVTFPTVDEIPVVKPVDFDSLPLDVQQYRLERAKNWPSRKAEEARLNAHGADAEKAVQLALEEKLARDKRKARLAEVLAEQRKLGHFEASEEIGGMLGVDGVAGGTTDGDAQGHQNNQKGKGNGKGQGGRGGRGAARGRNADKANNKSTPDSSRWAGNAKRPSPFESGDVVHPAKQPKIENDEGEHPMGKQSEEQRKPSAKGNQRACRFWAETGVCRRGDACGFKHEGEGGILRPAPPGAYAVSPGDGGDGNEIEGIESIPTGTTGTGDGTSTAAPGTGSFKKKQACRYFARGRCAAGDSCTFAHIERSVGNQSRNNNNAQGRGGTKNPTDQTLLKKLFAKEVRRDKSRLLQVFRFLVSNKFLNKCPAGKQWEESSNNLVMFPWVDDPEHVDKVKEKLKVLAAKAEEEDVPEDE